MRKIVFCDVDYTLLDFPHTAGITALYTRNMPRMAEVFNEKFYLLREGLRTAGDAYADFTANMKQLMQNDVEGVLSEPSASRELWAWACSKEGNGMSRQACIDAAEIYWEGILYSGGNRLYADAPNFLSLLRNANIEVVLVSTTDGRLILGGKTKIFRYDHEASREWKVKRYMIARSDGGDISFGALINVRENLISGDPVSKPDPRFWQFAVRHVGALPADQLFVVGDSYSSDIVGAAPFGMTTVLLDRDGRYRNLAVPRARHVVSALDEAGVIVSHY